MGADRLSSPLDGGAWTRVSAWSIISPMNSHLNKVDEEFIKCEDEMINKQISSLLTHHVRDVTRLCCGNPEETSPRRILRESSSVLLTEGARHHSSRV